MSAFDALEIVAPEATMDTVEASITTVQKEVEKLRREALIAGFDWYPEYEKEERRRQNQEERPVYEWARERTLASHRTVWIQHQSLSDDEPPPPPEKLRIDCEPKFCVECGVRLWEEERVIVTPMIVWRQRPKVVMGTETIRKGKNKGKKRARMRVRTKTIRNIYQCWQH